MTSCNDLLAPIVEMAERWQHAGLVERERLADVRERLESPPRVAVAGRVSTGKSTIVNALLHKAVAATGRGEVTRLVSHFRHGLGERVNVVSLDGRIELLHVHFPLDDTLPLPLGLDPRRISHLDVSLPLDRMKSLTVVDTPGLQSGNQSVSAGSARLLGSARLDGGADGVATADAVIYVANQDVRADDADTIDDFVAATGGGPASHVRVIAVVNRLDTHGGIDAPDSVRLRDRHAGALNGRVIDVVPMVANLAETVLAGRLTQGMIDDLIHLSGLDRADTDPMFDDIKYFVGDCGLEAARSTVLAERLGLHGIRLAIAVIRAGGYDVVALNTALVRASGIERLAMHLDELSGRGEALKARWGFLALSELAWAASSAPEARHQLAEQQADPRYDVLEELDIADSLLAGKLSVDDGLRAQAIAVLGAGSDEQRLERLGRPPRRDIERWMDRWLEYENTCATSSQAMAARRVHRRLARLRSIVTGARRSGEGT